MTGCDGTQTASELLGNVDPGGSFDVRIDRAGVQAKGLTVPPPLLDGGVRFVIPVKECLELRGPDTALLPVKLRGAIAGSKADSGLLLRANEKRIDRFMERGCSSLRLRIAGVIDPFLPILSFFPPETPPI